jgi:hypothetical protein
MMTPSRVFPKMQVCALFVLLAVALPTTAQTWTQLFPAGGPPAARVTHSAVYNTVHNRMIVFGGNSRPTLHNDVWVLTNADGTGGTPTWIQLIPSGPAPSPRGWHSAVYDEAHDRMIVFGGNPNIGNCFGLTNDVWVLANASGQAGTLAWTQLLPSGGPPAARGLHSAVYDPANNRMIIFAGSSDACGGSLNDTWILTNANGLGGTPTWIQLTPTGSLPAPRADHTAVFDEANNRMILFAGNLGPIHVEDLWVLSNANGLGGTPSWMQLTPTGTSPGLRGTHTAVYNTSSNRMTVFAGFLEYVGWVNDTWILSDANGLSGAPSWTQLSPTGSLPAVRNSHTAVLNSSAGRMIIFGGFNEVLGGGGILFDDTWVLDSGNGPGNQPPVANAGPDQTVIVGESVSFNGSASYDPDGTITNFHWDFDGNGTADGAIVNRVFSSAGHLTTTLTVTDNQGATGSDTMVLTVLSTTDAIQNLTQIVQSFNLQQGISNALDSKLQNVQDALSADNSGARQDAVNKLQAFISSVEAQRGNKLTGVQADALVAMARRIMAVI